MVDFPKTVNPLGRSFAKGVPILGAVANKLDAATNAALAPVIDPVLPDSYQKLPEETFGERYQHALDIQEGKDRNFHAAHPSLATGAEIGGGIASLIALLSAASTTGLVARLFGLTGDTLSPEMSISGATSGAGVNAADAALRNPDASSEDLSIAAAKGGLVGGIASPIGRAIGRFAKGGRPRVGYPAIVGEMGREVFVPDRAERRPGAKNPKLTMDKKLLHQLRLAMKRGLISEKAVTRILAASLGRE